MAPRRRRSAATATQIPGDDSEEGTGDSSYGLGENAYGNNEAHVDADADRDAGAADENAEDADGEWEDAPYEHGADGDVEENAEDEYDDGDTEDEYDEDSDGEYAENDGDETNADESDEDADGDAEDEYDEETDDAGAGKTGTAKAFTPPTALSAIRNALRSPRQRAQPATGTKEDEERVNFVSQAERRIGYLLGVAMVVLAVIGYFYDSHYANAKDLTLQNDYRHEAPFVLGITMFLGAMILIATHFKRRAAVGFTLLLAGIANLGVDPLIGFVYLGAGLWLVFRSMKRSPRARGATRAGAATSTARTGTRAGSRAESRASMAAAGRARAESTQSSPATIRSSTSRTIGRNGRLANTPTSGRYTPPKPTRHAPPSVSPEPEPTNRLSSWLKK